MTLRNQNRSPSGHQDSWRQDIISYRRARLQRSLARLRTHPAVNPTGPHGPHGYFNSSQSVASSWETYPTTPSSKPNPLRSNSPESSEHVLPGIVPALFNDLVNRELGVHPSKNQEEYSARLSQYLSAARAVTSTPSLSDPRFVTRLATGNEASRLSDRNLLSSVVSKPVGVTLQSQRVRDIHLAIQKARVKVPDVAAKQNAMKAFSDSPHLRRSTRKRGRSQREGVVLPGQNGRDMDGTSSRQSGELAAFRPSPESVRRTRSEATRARRSSASKTPSECCFCPDPEKFEGDEIKSELIGPFVDRRGNAKLFVHFDCACWAPQVYTDPANGQLRRVYDEYCRGRKLKCSSCGEKGATIGCYIQRCKKVFHYRCLESAKAYCVERFFAAFCMTHAHLGRKPSYKILMEAATIADVSAAQRREDTTYGLDAPHSRYTMLRRRETEIIFSRKWRISSHTGAFDTGKVVFSHRRKLVLGKYDRISVGDCVRVLRTSALDIASGRLAFMALAQKGEISNDVTAVQARAAIASRESTGLLLLRNLRNARQWGRDEIEVVRSIPMESNPSQPSPMRQCGPEPESQKLSREHWNGPRKHSVVTLSGQKRTALQDSGNMERDPDRKRQKVSCDNRSSNDVTSSAAKAERVSEILPSVRLPSFDRNARRYDMSRTGELQSGSDALNQVPNAADAMRDPSGPETPSRQESNKRRSPRDLNSKVDSPSSDLPKMSLRLKHPIGGSPGHSDSAPRPLGSHEGEKLEHHENREAEVRVRSAWEAFLDEELKKERLLRPDDSVADSLRNMARLWSLMTPAHRDAYERRGRESDVSGFNQGSRPNCAAPQRTASTSKCDAGLFSNIRRSHARTQSGSRIQLTTKEPGTKQRASVSLSVVKDVRRDDRVDLPHREQPNWDEFFPSALENDFGRTEGCRSPQYDCKEMVVNRVRAPPTRGKVGP